MKAKDLKKVFEVVLKYQEENRVQVTSLTIGNKYLKFKDENDKVHQIELTTITTE